jgi:3-methyladenine DNA glycosylase AlkC
MLWSHQIAKHGETMDQQDGAPLLKDVFFSRERLRAIADATASVSPGFNTRRFMTLVTKDLDSLGIMQRMRLVATSLHATLSGDFADKIAIMERLAPNLAHSFAGISLSEYVALYGQEDFDRSMQALAFFTRFGSSEFAIRPFLNRDLKRTLKVMQKWAGDKDEHVRRLASEGSRPRLPWAARIDALIVDPSPVAPILERLKTDDSLYVRKSVANHLNDIAKDHPDWVLTRLGGWAMDNQNTAWIAKRALRTLIKNGDAQALALIGAGGKAEVVVERFTVTPASVSLGERIRIDGTLRSTASEPQRLVIDYAIHYVKKNGATSRKVFKLRELDLPPGASTVLSVNQQIRDFTTRRHNAGRHRVELLVNGETLAESGFEVRI